VIANNPGKVIDRWITVGDNRGKLHVRLQFDDGGMSSDPADVLADLALGGAKAELAETVDLDVSANPETALRAAAISAPKRPQEVGKALESATKARELSRLVEQLRDEVSGAKARLAESEHARDTLERNMRVNEDRLRAARTEIEQRQRKLDEATSLARGRAPRLPRSGNQEDFEEHQKQVHEHETRLRELDRLREENDNLRSITDVREGRLQSELRDLHKKLKETEFRLRTETLEKQDLLQQAERASIGAQARLMRVAERASNGWSGQRRSREERDRDRRRRERELQASLGAAFETYKSDLDECLFNVEQQLAARRPERPEQPLGALEKLLEMSALPNRREPTVSSAEFQETLINFGLKVRHKDMEMLVTHFNTHAQNELSVDEFLDALREIGQRPPRSSASAANFRGLQNVSRRRGGGL